MLAAHGAAAVASVAVAVALMTPLLVAAGTTSSALKRLEWEAQPKLGPWQKRVDPILIPLDDTAGATTHAVLIGGYGERTFTDTWLGTFNGSAAAAVDDGDSLGTTAGVSLTWRQGCTECAFGNRTSPAGARVKVGGVNTIVVAGGAANLHGILQVGKWVNDAWASTDGVTWKRQTARVPFANRGFVAMAGVGDTLIAAGGIAVYDILPSGQVNFTAYSEVFTSADAGKTWSFASHLPIGSLSGAKMLAVPGAAPGYDALLVGGQGDCVDDKGLPTVCEQTAVLGTKDKGSSWTIITPCAGYTPRGFFGAVFTTFGAAATPTVLVMGGQNDMLGASLNDVWASSDLGATWAQVTALDAAAAGFPQWSTPSLVDLPNDAGVLAVAGQLGGLGSGDNTQYIGKFTSGALPPPSPLGNLTVAGDDSSQRNGPYGIVVPGSSSSDVYIAMDKLPACSNLTVSFQAISTNGAIRYWSALSFHPPQVSYCPGCTFNRMPRFEVHLMDENVPCEFDITYNVTGLDAAEYHPLSPTRITVDECHSGGGPRSMSPGIVFLVVVLSLLGGFVLLGLVTSLRKRCEPSSTGSGGYHPVDEHRV